MLTSLGLKVQGVRGSCAFDAPPDAQKKSMVWGRQE